MHTKKKVESVSNKRLCSSSFWHPEFPQQVNSLFMKYMITLHLESLFAHGEELLPQKSCQRKEFFTVGYFTYFKDICNERNWPTRNPEILLKQMNWTIEVPACSKTMLFFAIFTYVYACMCMLRECVMRHICRGQRLTLEESPQLPPCFRQGLLLTAMYTI